MKSKANQVRTRLLICANEEIKKCLSKKTLINIQEKAQLNYQDCIEFQESYSSSSCATNVSPITADNSGGNDNCPELLGQTRRKSIKLLHQICNLIKPISP